MLDNCSLSRPHLKLLLFDYHPVEFVYLVDHLIDLMVLEVLVRLMCDLDLSFLSI
jgi:hypothetical protein